MSRLFAMVVPIIPGKEAEWQQFAKELKDQHFEEFQASRRKAGVRERTFYQETPLGSFVVVTLEGENPEEAMRLMSQEKSAFAQWFMDKVKSTHDFDPSQFVQGPQPQLILDSGMAVETPPQTIAEKF